MNRIPANSELWTWSLGRAGWRSLAPVQVRLVEHFALLEGSANTEGG